MKKIVLILFSMLLCASAWAYDFKSVAPSGQMLYYNIHGTNVTVTNPIFFGFTSWLGYTKPKGDLIIPTTVSYNQQTYTVTSIGENAFKTCCGITSVTIPNTVTAIGKDAFNFCTGMTSVTLPNSIKTIGYNAFADCKKLITVTVPDSVTILEEDVFCNCRNLSSVVLPDSLRKIENGAFEDCRSLSRVIIPPSVTAIKSNAFSNCSIDTVFSEGVTPATLGTEAFDADVVTIVPCLSADLYRAANWPHVSSLEEMPEYHILSACDSLVSVAILAEPSCPSKRVTFVANPLAGYQFTQWNDGNTDNPRTVALTQDTTFVAQYDVRMVSLEVRTNNPDWGTVSEGGSFRYDSVVTVRATPAEHFHLVRWSDGISDNPRAIRLSHDTALTAIFAIDSVHIEVLSDCDSCGTVAGSGDYPYGDSVFVVASTFHGFVFSGWSNGVTDAEYAFMAVADDTLIAHFVSGGNVGVGAPVLLPFTVSFAEGCIFVQNVQYQSVKIFDAVGRLLSLSNYSAPVCRFPVSIAGVYFVQVGDCPLQKVLVVK